MGPLGTELSVKLKVEDLDLLRPAGFINNEWVYSENGELFEVNSKFLPS